jgi:hypothetical protein
MLSGRPYLKAKGAFAEEMAAAGAERFSYTDKEWQDLVDGVLDPARGGPGRPGTGVRLGATGAGRAVTLRGPAPVRTACVRTTMKGGQARLCRSLFPCPLPRSRYPRADFWNGGRPRCGEDLAAGNWKMNGTGASLGEIEALKAAHGDPAVDVLICPPATLVARMAAAAEGAAVAVGGQDCHAAETGAHTGDISAGMLADAGATAVIVGHSERREDHGETDADVLRQGRKPRSPPGCWR